MRIIAKRTLIDFYIRHAAARTPCEEWYEEVSGQSWEKPGDVLLCFPYADVITGKRFVFNIKGNHYRLVADIEFRLSILFIVWVGTHADYDRINVRAVKYVRNY